MIGVNGDKGGFGNLVMGPRAGKVDGRVGLRRTAKDERQSSTWKSSPEPIVA